ncbi:MAG TPA: methionine biosynthesis protein MetW, partial [Candidatus Hydrogenedentes bacterium]|nr:methionine biosynthesis protein MetW [Candidatus Hydrogenedentota bacterium]
QGRRIDHDLIVGLVAEHSRVLDLGCGDGALLCRLRAQRRIEGLGIERDSDMILACAQRGIAVRQADLDAGLGAFADKSFDYVALSMTLQSVHDPDLLLREMLRVGRRCIVSIPNFGHWSVRTRTLLRGRAPVTRNLPHAWFNSPDIRVLSLSDFHAFCAAHDVEIERAVALSKRGRIKCWPNLRAEEAVFLLRPK